MIIKWWPGDLKEIKSIKSFALHTSPSKPALVLAIKKGISAARMAFMSWMSPWDQRPSVTSTARSKYFKPMSRRYVKEWTCSVPGGSSSLESRILSGTCNVAVSCQHDMHQHAKGHHMFEITTFKKKSYSWHPNIKHQVDAKFWRKSSPMYSNMKPKPTQILQQKLPWPGWSHSDARSLRFVKGYRVASVVPSPCAETLGICSAGSVMPKYFKTTRIKELFPAKLVSTREDQVSLKQSNTVVSCT